MSDPLPPSATRRLRVFGALLPLFGYEPAGGPRKTLAKWTKEMSESVEGMLSQLEQQGLVRRVRNGRDGMEMIP